MFEQTAAQMKGERMPGIRCNPHDLAGYENKRGREDWSHGRLLDQARFEIGGEAVVVGVVSIRMETLVHPW